VKQASDTTGHEPDCVWANPDAPGFSLHGGVFGRPRPYGGVIGHGANNGGELADDLWLYLLDSHKRRSAVRRVRPRARGAGRPRGARRRARARVSSSGDDPPGEPDEYLAVAA
jgi:hypothetical protein